MCTFDFDLPNITSIDRRTVLCFTCWEKHLPRPSWKPGHKPPLHYPGCCWQAWDDESSMVCWGLALITAVIYWQLPYPLTTAITSRVIVVHRAENPSVCYLRVYMWTRLSKVRHKGQSELRAAYFFICAQFSDIFLKIRNFSMSFKLVVIRINPLAPSVIFKSNICLAVKHNLLCIVCLYLRKSKAMLESECRPSFNAYNGAD